jgi:hypothetical protein
MKTLHKLKMAAGLVLLVILAVSCIENEVEPMGDAGQTIIKLNPVSADGFFLKVAEPTNQPQTFVLLDVRRDTPNETALQASTTVTMTYDVGVTNAYNDANGTSFIPIPEGDYTTSPPASGGNITITFGPGEFAKAVSLTIPNAFNLDPANQYAMGYIMSVTGGSGILSASSSDSLVVQVLPKNLYDGEYEVTAINPMVDIVVPTLEGNYPFTYKLVTTGANTVDCIEKDNDYPLHPILSGGNWSYYGSFCPQVEFKSDGSGEIVNMTNYWGNPASNTRGTLLDDSQVWSWDPVTKDIRVKYYMTMTSAVPDPPHIRTTFDELWTYIGPRN